MIKVYLFLKAANIYVQKKFKILCFAARILNKSAIVTQFPPPFAVQNYLIINI